MKQLKIALAISCIAILTACSDAQNALNASAGKKHRVTLYSGGKQVGQWVSTGQIENETHSDGYFFMDAETGKLVRVSGTVTIEIQ